MKNNPWLIIIFACLCLFGASCASAPVVNAAHDDVVATAAKTENMMGVMSDVLADGVVTEEEAPRLNSAVKELAAAVNAALFSVGQAKQQVDATTPPMTKSAPDWMAWGAGVLGAVGAGIAGWKKASSVIVNRVNEERDVARILRGEEPTASVMEPVVLRTAVKKRKRGEAVQSLGPATNVQVGPHA